MLETEARTLWMPAICSPTQLWPFLGAWTAFNPCSSSPIHLSKVNNGFKTRITVSRGTYSLICVQGTLPSYYYTSVYVSSRCEQQSDHTSWPIRADWSLLWRTHVLVWRTTVLENQYSSIQTTRCNIQCCPRGQKHSTWIVHSCMFPGHWTPVIARDFATSIESWGAKILSQSRGVSQERVAIDFFFQRIIPECSGPCYYPRTILLLWWVSGAQCHHAHNETCAIHSVG